MRLVDWPTSHRLAVPAPWRAVLVCLWLVAMGAEAQVAFSDDFEGGTFAAGWELNVDAPNRVEVVEAAARTGVYAFRAVYQGQRSASNALGRVRFAPAVTAVRARFFMLLPATSAEGMQPDSSTRILRLGEAVSHRAWLNLHLLKTAEGALGLELKAQGPEVGSMRLGTTPVAAGRWVEVELAYAAGEVRLALEGVTKLAGAEPHLGPRSFTTAELGFVRELQDQRVPLELFFDEVRFDEVRIDEARFDEGAADAHDPGAAERLASPRQLGVGCSSGAWGPSALWAAVVWLRRGRPRRVTRLGLSPSPSRPTRRPRAEGPRARG